MEEKRPILWVRCRILVNGLTSREILCFWRYEHIVPLIGVKYDSWSRLRLEYIGWGSLEDQDYTPVDEYVRIISQCLSALAYLHKYKGSVHRDVKPGNILMEYLDMGNIYKLAHFGLSRESRDPRTIFGCRLYLAPELIKEPDRRRADRTKQRAMLQLSTSALLAWSSFSVPMTYHAADLYWPYCGVKKLSKNSIKTSTRARTTWNSCY